MYNIECTHVTDKPEVFIRAEDDQAIQKEGTVYSLVCDVIDANPDPGESDYTWLRNGTLITNENRKTLTQTLDRTQHDGLYTCEANNTVGPGTSQDYPFKVHCKLMNNLAVMILLLFLQSTSIFCLKTFMLTVLCLARTNNYCNNDMDCNLF